MCEVLLHSLYLHQKCKSVSVFKQIKDERHFKHLSDAFIQEDLHDSNSKHLQSEVKGLTQGSNIIMVVFEPMTFCFSSPSH